MSSPDGVLHLHAPLAPLVSRYVLAPIGVGATVLVGDLWREGEVSLWSAGFASVMLMAAIWGAVLAFQPRTLTADERGIHWRSNGKTIVMPWDQITDIGVARSVVEENRTLNTLMYGSAKLAAHMRRPMVGLSLVPDYFPDRPEGTRAYLRGFTGYDVNIPNDFREPTVTLVRRLRELQAAATAAWQT